MINLETKFVKCQEWIVRFDGKIKKSETLINSDQYHKDLRSSSDANNC